MPKPYQMQSKPLGSAGLGLVPTSELVKINLLLFQIMMVCGSKCNPDDPQPYIDASNKVISQLSDQVLLAEWQHLGSVVEELH